LDPLFLFGEEKKPAAVFLVLLFEKFCLFSPPPSGRAARKLGVLLRFWPQSRLPYFLIALLWAVPAFFSQMLAFSPHLPTSGQHHFSSWPPLTLRASGFLSFFLRIKLSPPYWFRTPPPGQFRWLLWCLGSLSKGAPVEIPPTFFLAVFFFFTQAFAVPHFAFVFHVFDGAFPSLRFGEGFRWPSLDYLLFSLLPFPPASDGGKYFPCPPPFWLSFLLRRAGMGEVYVHPPFPFKGSLRGICLETPPFSFGPQVPPPLWSWCCVRFLLRLFPILDGKLESPPFPSSLVPFSQRGASVVFFWPSLSRASRLFV